MSAYQRLHWQHKFASNKNIEWIVAGFDDATAAMNERVLWDML